MAHKSERRSIFYNLVKNEVTLTQAFYNFLRMECFKDMFIGLVNEKRESKLNSRRVKFENFETEMKLIDKNKNECGRADLVLNYEGKEYLFEVKIEPNTTLTDNQPQGYLEYLENDYRRLYFILPRNYYHKYELYERVGRKLKIEDLALIKEIVDPQIIYWDDIAKEIKRIAANGANPLLQEFYEILWSKWFEYEIVKFSKSEIELIFSKGGVKMDTIPGIITKLFKAVDNIKADINESKEYVYQSPDSYGYILNTSSKRYMIDPDIEIFYGVDYEIWQKYGCPFVIEVYTDNRDKMKELEVFAQEEGYKEFRYEEEEEIETVWFKCLDLLEDEYKEALQEGSIVQKFEEFLSREVEKIHRKFPSKNMNE